MTTTTADFKNTPQSIRANGNRATGAGLFPAGVFYTGNGVDPSVSGITGPLPSANGRAGPRSGWETGSWPARWIRDGIGRDVYFHRPAGAVRPINLPRFIDDGLSGVPGSGGDTAIPADEWLGRISDRLLRKLERQFRRFPAVAWRGQLS